MILIDTYKGRSKRKEVLGKIHKTDDNRRNTYTNTNSQEVIVSN